jgi:prepilin-type N-terminal cleavage/methylation domain-containing protein
MGEQRQQRDRPVGGPGFTLLELVVTLMVLALALAVVGPSVGRSTETIRARAQVARFAALLRHTREQAITSRRPHALAVDPAAHQVSILVGDEVRESRPLPEQLAVAAEPPAGLTVRFEPHGTSNGGDFRVTSGDVRYRVTVDPLTGRVRIDRQ